MKSKTLLMMVGRAAIGVIAIALVWNPLENFAFVVAQGQDPSYDLGSSYELWYRPPWGSSGGIVYWPSKEQPFEHVISEAVLEFAISGPWIIGRTAESWFGINKKSHDVHKLDSKEKLEAAIGLDLSTVKVETDPKPYLIVKPEALAAKFNANRLCWILLFVLPIGLGLGPFFARKLGRRVRNRR